MSCAHPVSNFHTHKVAGTCCKTRIFIKTWQKQGEFCDVSFGILYQSHLMITKVSCLAWCFRLWLELYNCTYRKHRISFEPIFKKCHKWDIYFTNFLSLRLLFLLLLFLWQHGIRLNRQLHFVKYNSELHVCYLYSSACMHALYILL